MRAFWNVLLKGSIWLAHYVADHPDQVLAAVQAVADAKQPKCD